ncbi:MAG: aminoglycoside phosphotransferase family protein [Pseudobdellovibrio sp.]
MEELVSEEIKKWISEQLGTTEFTITQLAGDASARRYYRVIQDEKTFVLMSWVPFDKENYPFLSVQKQFASCYIQVPEIIGVGEHLGVLLQEDLGDLTLERKFWENSRQESSAEYYLKTIDELLKIHDVATYAPQKSTANITVFDTAKFLWEMNYAKDNLLLGLLKLKLSDTALAELDTAFTSFCTILADKPKVICHRDFHSRNVMIKRNKVYVIDFQDARLGPVQYDLVSLFKDSYVDMNDEYSSNLMNYYLDNSKIKKSAQFSTEEFYKTYELQSLQRCFKACGSFASFMNLRQDKRYLKYLTPTLKRVFKALSHFPEYNVINGILIDAGALEKNYESFT